MNESQPNGLRRRLRFSLATLLVAVTMFCIWLGIYVNRASKQRRVVTSIEKLLGHVIYDYQIDESGYKKVERDTNGKSIGLARPPGPRWLRSMLGIDYFATVTAVRFRNRKIRDNDLELLTSLPRLRAVSIWGPNIADEGLIHLSSLTDLRTLELIATTETDVSLQMFSNFQSLRKLYLSSPNITDDGVPALCKIQNLESLSLQQTQVTDAGIKHLASVRTLRHIMLYNTKVTPDGVASLRKSLPDCRISH